MTLGLFVVFFGGCRRKSLIADANSHHFVLFGQKFYILTKSDVVMSYLFSKPIIFPSVDPRGSLNSSFERDQAMQMYGKFEGFALKKSCIVWVGVISNAQTPVPAIWGNSFANWSKLILRMESRERKRRGKGFLG